jgi:hypothetical protein
VDVGDDTAFDFGFVVRGVGGGFANLHAVILQIFLDAVRAFGFAPVKDQRLGEVRDAREFTADGLEQCGADEVSIIVEAFADGGFVGSVSRADGEDGACRSVDNHDAFGSGALACGGVEDEEVGAVAVDEPLLAWAERGGVVGVEESLLGFAAVEFGDAGGEESVDGGVGWVRGRGLLAECGVEFFGGEVLRGGVGK